jgi:hypothetical protein
MLLGYPTHAYWYHGIGIRAGVLVLPDLEVFVDVGVTFPMTKNYTSGSQIMRLENSQYLVGVGVGYTFRIVGPLALMPLAGFHLGISRTRENWSEDVLHQEVNIAIWTGLELRVNPIRYFGLVAAVILENLFNYEYFEWSILEGEVRTFSLAQFRLSVFAGACVTF